MLATRGHSALTKLVRRLRGVRLRAWGRLWGAQIGPGVEVERGVMFRHALHSGVMIGTGVYLGRGAIIDVPRGARLVISERSKVMHYVVIASAESVEIGAFSQVAEHSSVRDANHALDAGASMMTAPVVTSPVRVGDGAWIGRGTAVLSGATVGDGAVIAANAVVLGEVPPLAIAAGVPARVKSYRARG